MVKKMEFTQVPHNHCDSLNDIQFDYFGKRFATCSNDKTIKVWSLNEHGEWECSHKFSGHSDSIWRLSWAHPEFGELIASCSEDKTVCIFEEQEPLVANVPARWEKKFTIADCKRPIRDVKFAPRHLGLKLATACADGCVRLYEPSDVFVLTPWQLQGSFQVEVTDFATSTTSSSSSSTSSLVSEHGLTCLSWCDSSFEPNRIVVGGYSKVAVIWVQEQDADGRDGKWKEECRLGVLAGEGGGGGEFQPQQPIQDVAWAPSVGRSYHLIATATRETHCQIHILSREPFSSSSSSTPTTFSLCPHSPPISLASPSGSPIWRLAWNVTGTILSASAEDGSVSMWRRDFSGKWGCFQFLPPTNSSGDTATQGSQFFRT